VVQTIHHLINAGMRLASDKCRYRGFIYTVLFLFLLHVCVRVFLSLA